MSIATASTGAARTGIVRRLLRNPLALAAIAWLCFAVVVSLLAPWLVPYDPNRLNFGKVLLPPGAEHLLGTDSIGRDVFSRLIVGGQQTLLAGALAAIVATCIGVPAGLVAGYYGGLFDDAANWLANALLSLPGIIVLLAVRAAVGPNVWVIMAVFGVLLAPSLFRLTRTSVTTVRRELYVDAARVCGLSDAAIISRHILWVVRPPIIIQLAAVCAIAIAVQIGLDFLGLGSDAATWGQMVSEGFANIFRAPILTLWPTIPIALTIASLVLLGNGLRDALEDRRGRLEVVPSPASLAAAPASAPEPSRLASDPLLRVANLGIGYPAANGAISQVAQDVSFELARGEVLGVVGESGSGKTQTVFALLDLLPHAARITGGRAFFDGKPIVGDVGARRRLRQLRGKRIAYIPQEPMTNLDPAFTIGHQLTRPMVSVLGSTRKEAARRAAELLDLVGIRDVREIMRAYPHELSGGMAQRVLIAGAVSARPDLLVADEPTTALDVTVQAEVLDLLRDLQQSMGMAMLLVTHNFGVVADLCDRVVVMQKGRVVEEGAVRQVLREPRASYTRALLGAMLHGKAPMTLLASDEEGGDA